MDTIYYDEKGNEISEKEFNDAQEKKNHELINSEIKRKEKARVSVAKKLGLTVEELNSIF